MFYAETVINGVLHFQTTPNGEWYVMTLEMLTDRVLELKRELDEINKREEQGR